jgi:hypothetical protein
MDPRLIKLLAGVLIVLSLVGWGFYERSGKLSAQKDVVQLHGDLALASERQRETNRAVTALGTATTAANARAEVLAQRRVKESAPLVAQITKLEKVVSDLKSVGSKDCRDAFREWRNGS